MCQQEKANDVVMSEVVESEVREEEKVRGGMGEVK
jgi:hypothetical protein